MSEKTLANEGTRGGENIPDPSEETFAPAFAPAEGFTKVATTARATATRKIKTFDAAITRWANDVMTIYGGKEAFDGKDGGLVITIDMFPGIFRDEGTYTDAKAALCDWMILHGYVKAPPKDAPKGTFRSGGTWSTLITRGPNAGESNRYGEQIRITRVQ